VAEICDEELSNDSAGNFRGLFEYLWEAASSSRYVQLDLLPCGGLRPAHLRIELSVERAESGEPDADFVEHAEISLHGEPESNTRRSGAPP